MKVDTNTALLGSYLDCRAIVVHQLPNMNYESVEIYAFQRIILYKGTKDFIFPDSPDFSEDAPLTELSDKLAACNFDAQHDYVLLSGDILRIATVTAFITDRYGPFTALRYDNKTARYYPFRIDVTI